MNQRLALGLAASLSVTLGTLPCGLRWLDEQQSGGARERRRRQRRGAGDGRRRQRLARRRHSCRSLRGLCPGALHAARRLLERHLHGAPLRQPDDVHVERRRGVRERARGAADGRDPELLCRVRSGRDHGVVRRPVRRESPRGVCPAGRTARNRLAVLRVRPVPDDVLRGAEHGELRRVRGGAGRRQPVQRGRRLREPRSAHLLEGRGVRGVRGAERFVRQERPV